MKNDERFREVVNWIIQNKPGETDAIQMINFLETFATHEAYRKFVQVLISNLPMEWEHIGMIEGILKTDLVFKYGKYGTETAKESLHYGEFEIDETVYDRFRKEAQA